MLGGYGSEEVALQSGSSSSSRGSSRSHSTQLHATFATFRRDIGPLILRDKLQTTWCNDAISSIGRIQGCAYSTRISGVRGETDNRERESKKHIAVHHGMLEPAVVERLAGKFLFQHLSTTSSTYGHLCKLSRWRT